jgi:isopentenyl diphosphate isomerase/L-lactate dehydrogenase-like FMN-dependent dehydrogenase
VIGLRRLWRPQDYYSSGADDELTYNENVNAFQRIWLKPRILVNVADISIGSEILGHATKFPVYLSAVAMCGMGHAKGEVSWVQAAARAGVVFMVPNLSSKSFDDILAARQPGQVSTSPAPRASTKPPAEDNGCETQSGDGTGGLPADLREP